MYSNCNLPLCLAGCSRLLLVLMVRSRDVKEAPRFNFPGKLWGHFHASWETFHLSQYCLYCSYLWSYYLKTETIICTYNYSTSFVCSQTIFRVSVADTTIIREVHLYNPKHSCCKLTVLCTQTFTLCPHQHRACWDVPCVDGDTKWICVWMIRQIGSLQQLCFGSQRWTSMTMAVSATETCWNIVWLYTKLLELLCMHFVGLVFRNIFSLVSS